MTADFQTAEKLCRTLGRDWDWALDDSSSSFFSGVSLWKGLQMYCRSESASGLLDAFVDKTRRLYDGRKLNAAARYFAVPVLLRECGSAEELALKLEVCS